MKLQLKNPKDSLKEIDKLIQKYVNAFNTDSSISINLENELLDYLLYNKLRELTNLDYFLDAQYYDIKYDGGLILFSFIKEIKMNNLPLSLDSLINVIENTIINTKTVEFCLYQPILFDYNLFDKYTISAIKKIFGFEIVNKLPKKHIIKLKKDANSKTLFLTKYDCFIKMKFSSKSDNYFFNIANKRLDAFLGFLMFCNKNRLLRQHTFGKINKYENSEDIYNKDHWYYTIKKEFYYPKTIFVTEKELYISKNKFKVSNYFKVDLNLYCKSLFKIKQKSKDKVFENSLFIFEIYWYALTDEYATTTFFKLWILIEKLLKSVGVSKEWILKILGNDKYLYYYFKNKRNSFAHEFGNDISSFERDFMHLIVTHTIKIYFDICLLSKSSTETTTYFKFFKSDKKYLKETKKVLNKILLKRDKL